MYYTLYDHNINDSRLDQHKTHSHAVGLTHVRELTVISSDDTSTNSRLIRSNELISPQHVALYILFVTSQTDLVLITTPAMAAGQVLHAHELGTMLTLR